MEQTTFWEKTRQKNLLSAFVRVPSLLIENLVLGKNQLKRLPGVSLTRLAILRGEGHHRQPTWGGHADCSSVVDTLDTNKRRAGVLPLIYIRFVQFTLICD
jgi:hypothetical protein